MKRALLFDFDGTLFDTGPGVINCVKYALERLGIHETNNFKLRKFMGPPLYDMFRELYGFDDAHGHEAVRLYRERYQPTGIWECTPYPGMVELLKKLRDSGFLLAVATGKPTPSALLILEHYEMDSLFDFVCGSEFDGTRSKKSEVVSAVLNRFRMTDHPEQALMIGDRKYDVIGAKTLGVDCLGVRYGYGEPGELESAGAIAIVDSISDLEQYLLS